MLFGKKKEDFTIIVGCGRLGANLANTLSREGGSVLIIDKDKEAFRKLSPMFDGIALTGDATLTATLHDAQIEKAAALVSVTNYDNTNILVAQIAKEEFNIPHVMARLYDPERECVYREFNIDTICPSVLSLEEIHKLLNISEEGTHELPDQIGGTHELPDQIGGNL